MLKNDKRVTSPRPVLHGQLYSEIVRENGEDHFAIVVSSAVPIIDTSLKTEKNFNSVFVLQVSHQFKRKASSTSGLKLRANTVKSNTLCPITMRSQG